MERAVPGSFQKAVDKTGVYSAGRAEAESCGGEESNGARTPSLGVSCLERALLCLSRPPTLQAEEKEAKTVKDFAGAVAEW